jgi:alpha-ketoglutarate-dependent taurine dioxygenase
MDAAVNEVTELETVDLTPRIGTEIRTDAATLLSGRHTGTLRRLLEQRGVLVMRGINFDDEQQRAFTRTLGEPMVQSAESGEVMKISMDRKVNQVVADYQRGTVFWHIDMMQTKVPNLASILTPRQLSEWGGQTEFANTYAAFEDLSDAEKREYDGLKVMHALEASQLMTTAEPSLQELESWRARQPFQEQPLVWTHRSGRKSLVLGASAYYVVGKDPLESRYILTKLRDWATRPQFVYRHEWRLGDLLIWDNTGTMHRVLPYPTEGRLLSRTAIKGEEPVA